MAKRKKRIKEPSILGLALELEKREKAAAAPPSFLDPEFPKQNAFILDERRYKAVLCNRQSGKTHGAALALLKKAWETPNSTCLYLGLSRDHCRRIMWRKKLKVIDKQLGLGITFNDSTLTAVFPNGSVIYLFGVDANQDEMNKVLGDDYDLVVVDEVSKFGISVRTLVEEKLMPALQKNRGHIYLLGTPGNIPRGLFYEATTGQRTATWSVHKWTSLDNPHMRQQYLRDLDEKRLSDPLFFETPIYFQEWLGEWVIDDTKLIYRFDPDRNTFVVRPNPSSGRWHYILGVDFGSTDASALVVMAYHDHLKEVYVLECFKKTRMDFTDVAEKIKKLQESYDFDHMVADGSSRQGIEEIRNRHGLLLEFAEKPGKAEYIDLMNADLIQAKIKVQDPGCQELIDEWMGLIWNEKALDRGKREENSSCQNHLCDAALYAWRKTYGYFAKRLEEEPVRGTPEWHAREVKRMEAQAVAEWHRENDLTPRDLDYWTRGRG